MREKPLVTIVTATFNLMKAGRENIFRKCLESVHDQTYESIDHIIVDGASTDGTLNLIKEYADKGWITYISEPDKGIYDAMNKGVKMAKGKYVAFLNSDDFYHDKNGVRNSVEDLEESGADFSYAPAVIEFEDGKIFSDHPQCHPKISNVFFTMPFCHQTMFTKREVMMKEDLFDTKYKSAADYDFVIRLCLKKYKSVFVDKIFVTYRFVGVSSTDQKKSLDETADIWEKRYGKYFPMTQEIIESMRKNIYTGQYYEGIPEDMAKELRKFKPYFDYEEYLRRDGKENISTDPENWCARIKKYFKK
jgi:glycosyltransferase involved in cell wall biosynthesis